ncbi:unnamed protein product [Caenorhabditis brenneri]
MTAQSKPVNPDNFPFWKLPVLARSRVTKLMEQADVIHLSVHSKLFKRLLMAFKIGGVSIRFTFWCKLPENDDFSEECHFIQTYYSPSYDNVEFWCPHPDHRRIPGNHQHMLVHNNQMLVGRDGRKFEVNSALTFQEKLKTLEHITRHLLEIFHVENFKLDYAHTNHAHIFGSFVWDIVDKFRFIIVDSFNAPDRESVSDEEQKKNIDSSYGLTHEQTKFLFNEVKTDILIFLGYISNPKELTGIQLKHRVVEVRDRASSDWVTMDHVIDSESENLWVKFEAIEADEIVKLLKKWQSGEKLVNLEELLIEYTKDTDHQPLIEMLDKLEGVEMCPNQEAEKEYKVGPYTVRRTTDGKIATFYVIDEAVYFM